MHFSYGDGFGGPEQALDGYERLIHDVLVGHRTFFTTSEGVERLWEVAEPAPPRPTADEFYEQGSWGPGRGRDADRAPPLAPAERTQLEDRPDASGP